MRLIIERLMDAAARRLGQDPSALRRRNMIRPEQMPYTNAMAQVYDSGRFAQILDQGLALADWDGFAARREASKAKGKLRGRGIATYLEWTGAIALEETVTVNVIADGYIELVSATQARAGSRPAHATGGGRRRVSMTASRVQAHRSRGRLAARGALALFRRRGGSAA